MSLRLDKLPDRTPVRMSLSLDPALAEALTDYAEIYRQGGKRIACPPPPTGIGWELSGETCILYSHSSLEAQAH